MYHFYNKSIRMMRALLCIAFIAGGISTVAAQQERETFIVDASTGTVTVGGSDYTESKGSTWDYLKATNTSDPDTLWLNGFEWETDSTTALKVINGNIVIKLADGSENRIMAGDSHGVSYGIQADINLTITGNGSLYVMSGDSESNNSYGISCSNITINSGNIEVVGGNVTLYNSYGIHASFDVIIEGTATVKATGNSGTLSYGIFTKYTNSSITINPTNGSVEAIGFSSALYSKSDSVNAPNVPYIYWTGEDAGNAIAFTDNSFDNTGNPKYVKIATYNCLGLIFDASASKLYLDVDGDGTITNAIPEEQIPDSLINGWSSMGNTVTLDSFIWKTNAATALKVINGDIVIKLADGSENSIKGGGNDSINCYGIDTANGDVGLSNNLTIIGSGSLYVEAGNSKGSHSIGIAALSLTIKSADVTTKAGKAPELSYGLFAFENISINETATVKAEADSSSYSSYGICARGSITINPTAGSVEAIGLSSALYSWSNSVNAPNVPYIYWTNASDTSAANATRHDDMSFNNYINPTPKYIKIVAPAYDIITADEVKITAPAKDTKLALEGETITFTVSSMTDDLSITGITSGTPIDYTTTPADIYEFIMPAEGVQITGTFVDIHKSILISETDDPLTARIENTGTEETGRLRLTFDDMNRKTFTLESDEVASIPAGGYTDVTLIPAEGLEPGEYKVRLIVSGIDNKNLWDFLDMTYTVADDPVSNEQIESAAKLNAYVQDGILKITGLTTGKPWQVYSLNGLLLQTGIADSNEAQMMLPQKGIYIIASEGSTIKVIW